MRRTKKIRASKDEQLQEDTLPLTQRPEFIIGMTFLGVFVAFIISVLIYNSFTKPFSMSYSKPPLTDTERETQALKTLIQLQKIRNPEEQLEFLQTLEEKFPLRISK